jgi:aryl-alcohol dehydrogenase-like predicted oxidoreductase
MQLRQIGTTELTIAPLALGTNVFGWTVNEKDSFTLLDTFIDSGCNLIDTADMYPRWATGIGGESETTIGKWLKQSKKRSQIILATKVGKDMGEGKKGLSPAYIQRAVEDSLRRLQTDYIDLYQSHDDDPSVPLEVTLAAYETLIKAGKVRYIGASNYSATRLQEALDISKKFSLPRYECFQPHYNLVNRALFEGDLQGVCRKNKLGVIPYFPLASGFLTGKYRNSTDVSKSVRGSGALAYLNDKTLQLLNILDTIALETESSVAAVSLAWLMAQAGITAPIASATSPKQLLELIRSTQIKLSTEQIQLLNSTSI